MKKTYRIKAVQYAFLTIEADSNLTQDEIYEIAAKNSKQLNYADPYFNIIRIDIDDKVTGKVRTKVIPEQS